MVWEFQSQTGRGEWWELCLVVVVVSSGVLGGKVWVWVEALFQRTDSAGGAETTWDVIKIVGGPSVAEWGQESICPLGIWPLEGFPVLLIKSAELPGRQMTGPQVNSREGELPFLFQIILVLKSARGRLNRAPGRPIFNLHADLPVRI
jgi:hypothetical protein